MFVITGLIDGKQYVVKYEDGVLSGDPFAVDKTKNENMKDHGNLGLPPSVTSDYLEDEHAAHMLITNFVFNVLISNETNWKPIPKGMLL